MSENITCGVVLVAAGTATICGWGWGLLVCGLMILCIEIASD